MKRRLSVIILVLLTGSAASSQDPPVSRPASRASEIGASEWRSWLERLRSSDEGSPASRGAVPGARFAAEKMEECGVRPAFVRKDGKATFLQPVAFVDAGFDPKQTFLETTETRPAVRIAYGEGFGVRGLDDLDVSGPIQSYSGDATSEKVVLRESLDLDKMGPIGKIIKEAGGRLERPLVFETKVKDRVVFSLPRNNDKNPSAVPRYARGLRSNGAKAVIFVEDRGVDAASAPRAVFRADRFRRPAREDPPALFVTKDACRSLGNATGVALKVRYAVREFDVPNVAGTIGGTDDAQAVLVLAAADPAGFAPAVLLAVARQIASTPVRRLVIVCVASRPDVEPGGQDWFLAHPPVPLKKVAAAVHLVADEGAPEPVSEMLGIVAAKRAYPDLESACLEAFRARGMPAANAGDHRAAQRAVDATAARGIPAIGLLVRPGSMEDCMAAARVAAELVRALADRVDPASPRK